MKRRAFLGRIAGAAALASPLAKAGCLPKGSLDCSDALPLAIFLDDSQSLQGSRLDEFRGILAMNGLNPAHLRFESIIVDIADKESLRRSIEAALKREPAAFLTASTDVALRAAQYKANVPLVFATRLDPLRIGLVDRLGPRDANLAGFTYDLPVSIDRKALEVLSDAFPGARRIAIIADREWAENQKWQSDVEGAAARFGFSIERIIPRLPWETDVELRRLNPRSFDAWYAPRTDVLMHATPALVSFFDFNRLPSLFGDDRTVRAGGLMSYGLVQNAHWNSMAAMLRLIIAGVSARDIPIERPKDFVLAVNAGQARKMGIAIPKGILKRANLIV
ncbi:MAG: ABC transporter substrate binding protein [Usitatibacter sp.]